MMTTNGHVTERVNPVRRTQVKPQPTATPRLTVVEPTAQRAEDFALPTRYLAVKYAVSRGLAAVLLVALLPLFGLIAVLLLGLSPATIFGERVLPLFVAFVAGVAVADESVHRGRAVGTRGVRVAGVRRAARQSQA